MVRCLQDQVAALQQEMQQVQQQLEQEKQVRQENILYAHDAPVCLTEK